MYNRYTVAPADAQAFADLAEDLATRIGSPRQWVGERDVPGLKPWELATVLRAKPGLFDDWSPDPRDVADILEGKTILGGVTLGEYLTTSLMGYIKHLASTEVAEAIRDLRPFDEIDRSAEELESRLNAERADA